MILAVVISFVTTLLLGFEDIPVEDKTTALAPDAEPHPLATVSAKIQ